MLAAYQAVKFYNYSIKKNYNAEPFKPFITEEAIVEESAEIDEFLNAKNAHNSEDSFGDSSDENIQPQPEVAPELPPPLPKKSSTLPAGQKPALFPKPQVMPKPPRTKTTHKAMEDLRLIDDKEGHEVNDNIDHLYTNTKSAFVTNKTADLSSTPTDNSNNNTFIIHDNQASDGEEPILRSKKPQRVTKTDEEVYAELKSICNLGDPLRKYSKIKEVGKGASGVVFIATDLETQNQVAIKTIDLKNQSSKELILNEIRVLIDFNHKNLVNFLEAYFLEESDTLWVILEFMNG